MQQITSSLLKVVSTQIQDLDSLISKQEKVINEQASEIKSLKNRINQKEMLSQPIFDNPIDQLLTYPKSLNALGLQIQEEFEKLKSQLQEKEQELHLLRSGIEGQRRSYKPNTTQVDEIIKQHEEIDDILIELEKKLYDKKQQKQELEQIINTYGDDEKILKQLKQQISVLNEQLVVEKAYNQEVRIQLKKLQQETQNLNDQLEMKLAEKQDFEDQVAKTKSQLDYLKSQNIMLGIGTPVKGETEKLIAIDDLVKQNQAVDDLMNELQTKLLEKQQAHNQLMDQLSKQNIQENEQNSSTSLRPQSLSPKKELISQLEVEQHECEIIQQQLKQKQLEIEELRDQLEKEEQEVFRLQYKLQEEIEVKVSVEQQIQSVQSRQLIIEPTVTSYIQEAPTINVFGPQTESIPQDYQFQIDQLKETIKQQESQIEFLKFEIQQKDEIMNMSQHTYLQDLNQQNQEVESRIQELKKQLSYKIKRKDQLESIVNEDQKPRRKSFVQNTELMDLQEQLHEKNMNIVQLYEEISRFQKQLYDKEQELQQRDVELRYQALMKTNEDQCEKADELVKKNLSMDELIHSLEVRLVEKESKLKELEYLNSSKNFEIESNQNNNSFYKDRESIIRDSGINSYDQDQDHQFVQQQQILAGFNSGLEHLKSRVECQKYELQEKDKIIEQLKQQLNDLKRSNFNQQILATQDVSVINRQINVLQEQADNLVKQNLALEDVIHELEYKLQEKKNKQEEVQQIIQNMMEEEVQLRQLKSDEMVKKNLELDEKIQQMESRLIQKQQQQYELEQRLSQHQRSMPQRLPVFHEDQDIIQDHNSNLSELTIQIAQITESVRQLSQDDIELEFLLKQKKEKQSQIEQLKLFIQSSTDVLQDLQSEQQIKQEQVEKMKSQNKDIEQMVNDLQNQQVNLIEDVNKSQQNVPNWLNQNMESSKRLNELQKGQQKVKEQIKNLESLILDLQIVVKEKQEELQRISQENYQLSILTRKQKQKRDHLLREQMPLGEKVGLLEQQVNDLVAENKRLQLELARLFQEAESAKQVKQTKEQQISALSIESSQLDQNIMLLKDDIEQAKILEQQLLDQQNQYKQKNALIEQEIKIYTEMNLDGANINKKIEDLTHQISEEKQLFEQLIEELQIQKEQVLLIVPQKDEIQKLYLQTKQQYDQSVEDLSELQKQQQKVQDQKNQVTQEVNYLKLFTENQEKQLVELQALRIKLDDNIKQENTLKNAIQDKADRIQQELDRNKQAIQTQIQILEKQNREKEQRQEQIQKIQTEIEDQKNNLNKLTDQQMKHLYQLDQIAKLDKDMERLMKDVFEKEEQVQQYAGLVYQKQQKVNDQKQKFNQLEDELKFYEREEEEIKKRISEQDEKLSKLEREFQIRSEKRSKFEDEIAKAEMDLSNLEEMLRNRDEELRNFNESKVELMKFKQQYSTIQGEIREKQEQIQEFEKQRSKLSEEIKKEQEQLTEINQEIYQTKVKEEEMNFQIQQKLKDLDILNDQFRKLDDDAKMLEAVIQLKEKELKQYQDKKETLKKELDIANFQVVEVKKQLNKKKQQKPIEADNNEVEVYEDALSQQISCLNTKNLNLKDDLQRLVQSQSQPIFQTMQQIEGTKTQLEELQLTIREKDKKLDILEQQLQQLSMHQSKVTIQSGFYFDDEPLLLELQDKFTKESEMLDDLQQKLKRTAERHHELALKLQDWAEKEHKLAIELDQRRQCVEKIEKELEVLFQKQSDLESDQVNLQQRMYQLELDNQELNEQEIISLNRIKEKKDYVQVLFKNLIEMDEKLLQLRNRMAVYSREGRQLAEQVENLENEKEMREESLQVIQEELESLELEKGEKQSMIQQIKKEIQDQNTEKDKLEIQYALTHSKNQQLKLFIGVEESLYKKMQTEFEIQQKRDQSKYENMFVCNSTQTYYEVDQIEVLMDNLVGQKITKKELQKLKTECYTEIQQLFAQNKSYVQDNVNVRNLIQFQQILIQVVESENILLSEKTKCRKSLTIQSEEQNTFTLELIDTIMNSSSLIEISINEHSLNIGDKRIPRQWIVDKYFDYNHQIYPLGVLYIVYKVSLCQVITLALTGTKIIQLYSQI
ncbi:unnamed protein product (macronuclear) [Paramecium tetraurelia]|uniref:Uncharacterized protein n=1 Tax=Paramecium tetraurelia TaxID=5888 RepID=A0CCF8_PARTE|nr:uncharacterized protein GSPATT00037260001 [Paramecium tetraurelia]CAK68475.1 unnamed protein product [Paramecium tetraurelia]|eukprot:XP_001435872.1 hypothetical protein (macronuclear) [Paramecium tetraurelia strain d4-2]